MWYKSRKKLLLALAIRANTSFMLASKFWKFAQEHIFIFVHHNGVDCRTWTKFYLLLKLKRRFKKGIISLSIFGFVFYFLVIHIGVWWMRCVRVSSPVFSLLSLLPSRTNDSTINTNITSFSKVGRHQKTTKELQSKQRGGGEEGNEDSLIQSHWVIQEKTEGKEKTIVEGPTERRRHRYQKEKVLEVNANFCIFCNVCLEPRVWSGISMHNFVSYCLSFASPTNIETHKLWLERQLSWNLSAAIETRQQIKT